MQLFLTVTPDHLRQALCHTDHVAHVAYLLHSDGHLHRQDLLLQTRGGLMSLSDGGLAAGAKTDALAREVWRECAVRNFAGVVADFEGGPTGERLRFLQQLETLLLANRRSLYVPERFGRQVRRAFVLIGTAISGGTLPQRLEEAALAFGSQRLALDLERLQMDFPLPCPGGEGKPLTREQLSEKLERYAPPVFYSADLAAKYFTYRSGGESHFVLFDDADTLLRKIQLGANRGIATGFLMYPEVEDILPALFPFRD